MQDLLARFYLRIVEKTHLRKERHMIVAVSYCCVTFYLVSVLKQLLFMLAHVSGGLLGIDYSKLYLDCFTWPWLPVAGYV